MNVIVLYSLLMFFLPLTQFTEIPIKNVFTLLKSLFLCQEIIMYGDAVCVVILAKYEVCSYYVYTYLL